MPKGVSKMRDVKCRDCAGTFQGFPQSRRCPACARTRNLSRMNNWRRNHPEQMRSAQERFRLAPDHHKAMPETCEAFGTIPGTEWVASMEVAEIVPALALQRVPADRMEQWIREYLRMQRGAGMKFRKKPIVVEAAQWFPGKNVDGVVMNWDNNPMTPNKASVLTLEGWLNVSPGDWVVTGVKGEHYPVKGEIFPLLYEAVE